MLTELARLRTKYRGGSAGIEIPKIGDSHCDVAVALMAAVGELDQFGAGGDTRAFFERQRERQQQAGGAYSRGMLEKIF